MVFLKNLFKCRKFLLFVLNYLDTKHNGKNTPKSCLASKILVLVLMCNIVVIITS